MSQMHGGFEFSGVQGDLYTIPITLGEVCLKVDAPAVQAGDSVVRGQCLGTMEGRSVLSPFAGTVAHLGDGVLKIVGDDSGRQAEVVSFGKRTGKTLAEATPEELLEEIRSAGIVEADGQVLADHMESAMERSAAGNLHHAVISLLEPDPASLSYTSLGAEFAEAIAGGLTILLRILRVRQGTIVCDSARAFTLGAIRSACRKSRLITIETTKNRYPIFQPRLLLHWLFQKEMSFTSSPEAIGVFYTDVESCIALHSLFSTGIPRLSTRVTFREKNQTKLYDIPLGMTLASLKNSDLWSTIPRDDGEKRFMVKPSDSTLWCMGLMNGAHPADPIDRSVFLLMPASERAKKLNEQGDCIRCGRCVEACPMYLAPYRYLPEKPWVTFFSGAPRDAVSCIGCGCCSYACPAGLPLRRYALRAREEERIRIEQRQKASKKADTPADLSVLTAAQPTKQGEQKEEKQKGGDDQ